MRRDGPLLPLTVVDDGLTTVAAVFQGLLGKNNINYLLLFFRVGKIRTLGAWNKW